MKKKMYANELTVSSNHQWLIISCNKRNRFAPLRVIIHGRNGLFSHVQSSSSHAERNRFPDIVVCADRTREECFRFIHANGNQ